MVKLKDTIEVSIRDTNDNRWFKDEKPLTKKNMAMLWDRINEIYDFE